MKKAIAILSICSVIMACGNDSSSTDTSSAGENQSAAAQQSSVDTNVNKIGTDQPDTAGSSRGEALISQNDCLTCHQVEAKLIGPSYQEVADKYTATDENISMLAGKIIEGGAGNWGDIPMTPHPDMSTDDAKEMVRYILSLKK